MSKDPTDFSLSLSLRVFTTLQKPIDAELIFAFAQLLDEQREEIEKETKGGGTFI